MKFGDFEIDTFVEQHFRLDGGTMFGVIPKSIWNKLIPADENNLIPMVTNLFLLSAHGYKMIFDIGLGDTLSEREKKIYGTDGISHLDEELAARGLGREDIDYVILTHLHTDHAAGAVIKTDNGFAPRFPNAKYIVSSREWNLAVTPDERTAAVYTPERMQALVAAGQVEFINPAPEVDLFDGIRAVHTGGHTGGHFGLEINSGGTSVFYYADIYTTSAHMKTAYVPGTDLYPVETMAVKRRTLPRILENDVIMAFDHDINNPLARIRQEDRKLVAHKVEA
ncbi:MBL fold metallo-hydrolase [candidate division GN15 bacterium]|nr:MBL fold metallo-hydrolase [candidate division GN15 bacterium]